MEIDPSETSIQGKWLLREGHVVADENCAKIRKLVAAHLKKIGSDSSGWDSLYRDPDDGRLWELTYPQGELQGGGPPELRCLTADEAKAKYGPAVGCTT
jgi:Immunity protein 27